MAVLGTDVGKIITYDDRMTTAAHAMAYKVFAPA